MGKNKINSAKEIAPSGGRTQDLLGSFGIKGSQLSKMFMA